MNRIPNTFLALLALCIGVATAAPREVEVVKGAIKVKRYQFVGISELRLRSDAGIGAMHAACQDKFGSSARMCTTVELVESPKLAGFSTDVPVSARLQPVITGTSIAVDPMSGDKTVTIVDALGTVAGVTDASSVFFSAGPSLSCRDWSTDVGQAGTGQMAIRFDSQADPPIQFFTFSCASGSIPMACCELRR